MTPTIARGLKRTSTTATTPRANTTNIFKRRRIGARTQLKKHQLAIGAPPALLAIEAAPVETTSPAPSRLTIALPLPRPEALLLLPSPSAGVLSALTCPGLLMAALAAVLAETRRIRAGTERLAVLPAPPTWMASLDATRDTDAVTTVSLPSGWDAVSARLSSSSIFNVFSDLAASPRPSLFSIDPTGAPSTVSSTVSVPAAFWDSSSTVSVAAPVSIGSSAVSIPSGFFLAQEAASSTSSLFADPSSAHSNSYTGTSSSSASASDSFCSACQMHHSRVSSEEETSDDSESYAESEVDVEVDSEYCGEDALTSSESSSSLQCGCDECLGATSSTSNSSVHDTTSPAILPYYYAGCASSTSSTSSGYETEAEEPRPATTTTSTQTPALSQIDVARMLAECDSMLEKLVEMRKKLEELL